MPSPLSVIVAVLVTSMDGSAVVIITVGSLELFPSVSSPSSLTSLTSVPVGLLPVAVTVFETPPASRACASIT